LNQRTKDEQQSEHGGYSDLLPVEIGKSASFFVITEGPKREIIFGNK